MLLPARLHPMRRAHVRPHREHEASVLRVRFHPHGAFEGAGLGRPRVRPVCFVFGHCFLALPQPLFLLLEKRFRTIKSLMRIHTHRRPDCPSDHISSRSCPRIASALAPASAFSTESSNINFLI